MLVSPDFSEIQEDLSAGTYKVVVRKGEVKEWPSGGKYINWELETTGEAQPKNNGRRLFHKTAIAGKAAFQLQKFYRAATGTPLTSAFDTESLVGKQVTVEVVDGINRTTGQPTGYLEVKNVTAAN